MNEDEKRNVNHGCIFIVIYLFISLLLPFLFIFKLFFLNSLEGRLYDLTAPIPTAPLYSEEKVLAVTMLIKVVKFNIILDAFYFAVLLLSFLFEELIANLQRQRNEKIWAKRIYFILLTFISAISVFIVFFNLQYFSKTIMTGYSTSYYIYYAVICNIFGICFCVLIWSKFFDEIVLFFKFIINKLKKF